MSLLDITRFIEILFVNVLLQQPSGKILLYKNVCSIIHSVLNISTIEETPTFRWGNIKRVMHYAYFSPALALTIMIFLKSVKSK